MRQEKSTIEKEFLILLRLSEHCCLAKERKASVLLQTTDQGIKNKKPPQLNIEAANNLKLIC